MNELANSVKKSKEILWLSVQKKSMSFLVEFHKMAETSDQFDINLYMYLRMPKNFKTSVLYWGTGNIEMISIFCFISFDTFLRIDLSVK